ncbi:MAG: aminomethyl-transferring glycine dehydrogenase subunit GcvPB [Fibrobacterota bacterium]
MKTVFEKSKSGRRGCFFPEEHFCPNDFQIPAKDLMRQNPAEFPELTEGEVMRHYTRLASMNFSVDANFYPLGSCTMKYNPRINEETASLPSFTGLHPLADPEDSQGTLEIIYRSAALLSEITGMEDFCLQPSAGAHGELAGMMLIKAYHEDRGDTKRKRVLVPDSAHGTNPASAALCGYSIATVPSSADGEVSIKDLEEMMGDDVAGIMLTNPNTLGIFESRISEISSIVHKGGGLLYYDGANLNAVLGKCRPGDMGFDVVHVNLHKTFSTPHGGGGPGSGPIGVSKRLLSYLPGPVISEKGGRYILSDGPEKSIGRITGFYGNIGVIIRAFSYILSMGNEGLKAVGENAVLNANYLLNRLKGLYSIPYGEKCMHEFVVSGSPFKEKGISILNIAKRIIDSGMHPPTVYFPLIVKEAMMIEPTETESLETLDEFVGVMADIAAEADSDPEKITAAPLNTPVKRLDEARAVKKPVLKYIFPKAGEG